MEGGKDIKAAVEERGTIMIELPNLSFSLREIVGCSTVQFILSFYRTFEFLVLEYVHDPSPQNALASS